MKTFSFIQLIVTLLLSSMFIIGGYFIMQIKDQQDQSAQMISALTSRMQIQEVQRPEQAHTVSTGVLQIPESRVWSSVQQRLKNSVVQFWVQKNEFNWQEPYKVPTPSGSLGSGFFISDDGQIVTNAHVVNQGIDIRVQIPMFGKHQFPVDLIGIMPEQDIALVKLKPEALQMVKQTLGAIPVMPLGNSDAMHRADEIMALGFPLGQESLKSTKGVISGFESSRIQIDAAINPGSSGGPSVNIDGQVIGINSSGIVTAQNVGYIIPINILKTYLHDLQLGGLVRKPYLGIFHSISNEAMVRAEGNPLPGGPRVVDVLFDSPLYGKIETGDMVYAINGHAIDMYGEIAVDWTDDKVDVAEYVNRLAVGQEVVLTIYRQGEKKTFQCTFDRKKLNPIRYIYPAYESVDFECVGGCVIMPLSLNHISMYVKSAPGLTKFLEGKNQKDPELIVTYIMPNSPMQRARIALVGQLIDKVNGKKVRTLQELREALQSSGSYITILTTDQVMSAITTDEACVEEPRLAQAFAYHITPGMQQLLEARSEKEAKKD